MGWFESFCFTLGWQLRKQEKKERNEQASFAPSELTASTIMRRQL